MTLADFLIREGLSQSDFAGKLGVTQATVSRYVGGRMPRKTKLEAIRDITGGAVTADDFLRQPEAAE